MIEGYHIIFTAYGFWLPNDPRGSWSHFVGAWDLLRFGRATKTTETRSLAKRRHDRNLRLEAKSALKYPPVKFTGIQARAVARGFATYFERATCPVWACTVMPDHVHLVVGRGKLSVEQLVIQLKGAATRQLEQEGIHPLAHFAEQDRPPKCWARGQWKVYLDREDIPRAIRYANSNPTREGLKEQTWSFITPSSPN